MAKRLDIVLQSDYPPETCLAKLSGEMDVDQWTLFSFSGYRGRKPILGRIKGKEFRLHKRRYWHNRSAPVLFGRMTGDQRGTVVEAYWDIWRWARIFMRAWLGFAIVVGALVFFTSLRDVIEGKTKVHDDAWIGLIIPLTLVLGGFSAPAIGSSAECSREETAGRIDRAQSASQPGFRGERRQKLEDIAGFVVRIGMGLGEHQAKIVFAFCSPLGYSPS